MRVAITSAVIDTGAEIELLRRNECGAVVAFEGDIRSPDKGIEISHLEYEAYLPVATRQIESIVVAEVGRHGLVDSTVVHRTGHLVPGETAFLVAVVSPHREAAFAGCSSIVDRVKAEAAIWKTEYGIDGRIVRSEPSTR